MADERLGAIDALLRQRDASGARVLADAVLGAGSLAASDRFVALMLRSRAHEQLRNLPAAIADVEGALALNPTDARACNELGILCADARQRDRAIDAFRRATRLDPRHARAWNNLGTALREAGRLDEARDAFEHAARADPRYALASANLGIALRDLGRDADAVNAFRAALAIDPRHRLALTALGGLRRAEGNLDEAATLYERALAIDDRDALTWLLYAGTLAERDDLEDAVKAYERAAARDARLLRAVFGRYLTLPMIATDSGAVLEHRRAFEAGLASVEAEVRTRVTTMEAENVVDEVRWTNFLLAYQGEDDRGLQARFASIVGAAIDAVDPSLRKPMPRRHRGGRRLRVGFVSSLFRDGTVGRYFEHWITDLPRDAFDVQVYALQSGFDTVAQRIAHRADRYHPCARFRPSQAAALIHADAPDVLIYPELGMDATTFAIAALRLAPLQCAGWGHPVTTGHATVDVFFTSAGMEPQDGDSHYTERLIRLPGIGTRYLHPEVSRESSREALGLPSDGTLFLCPQSLFKISPEDDVLFTRVLGAVPDSRLVFFEGRHPNLTAKFSARLRAACEAQRVAAAGRIGFVPQCAHDTYLAINRACDAMLDTSRWSGGNTTLDAIACALPVVTLPGRFMRARQSAAMLELARVPELIARSADDYVAIAKALAGDAGFRASLSRRLSEGQPRIFDDPAPVPALADWLLANG